MSDFLTRLVDQALNLAPVVQPLIASTFGPAAPNLAEEYSGFAVVPSPFEPALAEERQPVARESGGSSQEPACGRLEPASLPVKAATSRPERLVAPALGLSADSLHLRNPKPAEPREEPQDAAPDRKLQPGASDEPRFAPPLPRANRPNHGEAVHTQLSFGAPAASPHRLPALSDSTLNRPTAKATFEPAAPAFPPVRRIVERRFTNFESTAARLTAEEAPTRAARPSPATRLLTGGQPELAEPATSAPTLPVRAPARQSQLQLKAAAPSASFGNPRAEVKAPAAPAIQISIGRIEVRAVTPPAPAPTKAPSRTPARLSLDEYLRAQAGGKP
jgi:hypothetical protein